MKFVFTDKVNMMIEQGYISVSNHPTHPYRILNYTQKCQLERVWNDVTCMCRGLIIDADDNIVAKAFDKFFNYEEINDNQISGITIPTNLPFRVYDKLDGSLGIMYWIDGVPYIATRGSFTSDQAIHATNILHGKYKNSFDKLDPKKTYIFEIIYPENHLIVNYGDTDDIFLLAVVDTETFDEEDPYKYSDIFNVVKEYDGVEDYNTVRDIFAGDNKEGFVIKFSNGFRMKMKFAEYFRLHSLLNSVSEKKILECVINHDTKTMDEIIDNLDEENRIFYSGVRDGFYKQYCDIEQDCKTWICDNFNKTFDSDAERAKFIIDNTGSKSSIIFKMLRNQNYDAALWRHIKNNFKAQRKDGRETV